MAIIPITLVGENLGKRHQYLNSLVLEAFKNNVPFDSVKDLPEHSSIDRLFKIDLAAKYKNVDYIIENLKNEDMLYVCRAMQFLWLYHDNENANIINPVNLEQNVYPEMRTNAVTKMKRFISMSLKNETRCKDFYDYYKKNNIDYAIKFLPKSPVEFFLKEIENIETEKITPQCLKILCERSTRAAEVYFRKIEGEKNYSKIEPYLTKLRIVLKLDPDLYFDFIENYFLDDFKRLNKQTTKYIMEHHMDRFNAKPELYTARVLDMPTVATYVKYNKMKDLIIQLARAKFLGDDWFNSFNYEMAKPLLTALDSQTRAVFCKMIFKDKQFGKPVSDHPYHIPSKPYVKTTIECSLDDDDENYDDALKGEGEIEDLMQQCSDFGFKFKTELDQLYDEYRFKSFEKTFNELRQRIRKESKTDMRKNMMLVLVSKTGGRAKSIEELLRFLLGNHSNEPVNLKAAIVRSLVKRASAWRLPKHIWKLFVQFGRDLGLDGQATDIECHEGVHAVILRQIFEGEDAPAAIWNFYFNHFTPLIEYKLKASEKRQLHERLPAFIITNSRADPAKTVERLFQVCDAIEAYKLNIETYPGLMDTIATFVRDNPSTSQSLLLRLFKARVGRRLLFKENFEVIHSDASFINALRHDTSMLSDKRIEDVMQNINNLHHNQFMRKIALYFGERDGIAMRVLKLLEQKLSVLLHVRLARPIALLAARSSTGLPIFRAPEDNNQLKIYNKMISSFQQSYTQLTRGRIPLDLKVITLAVLANWVHTSSLKSLQDKMDELMIDPHHARLVLALRSENWPGLIATTLPKAAKYRPMRTLAITLRLLRQHPHIFQPEDFKALKHLISTINLKKKKCRCYENLASLNKIPRSFRAEYSTALYQNLSRLGFCIDPSESGPGPSYRMAIPLIMCMNNHIYEIDPNLIKDVLIEILSKELTMDMFSKFGDKKTKYYYSGYYDFRTYMMCAMTLIARYLVTSTSELDVKKRLDEVYKPFELKVRELWSIDEMNKASIFGYGFFVKFCKSLQYTKVFLSKNDYSLIVLERVCVLCDEVSPIINNFTINYRVRYIILFRQALKQCAIKRPDLFQSGKVNGKEGLDLLMYTFGNCVSKDLEALVAKYFLSIRIIYTKSLINYIISNFERGRDFLEPVIKALLSDESQPNAMIVGLSFYNKVLSAYTSRYDHDTEICNTIKNIESEKVRFFMNFSEIGDFWI